MLRHLFKLIWNKKRQNLLLMSEILVSFLVMYAIFTLVVYYYNNYKKPMGFSYDNVWSVSYNFPGDILQADSVKRFRDALENTMRTMPKVKEVTFCSNNIPFSNSTFIWDISYNNYQDVTNYYICEPNYPKTLGVEMESGRWFDETDIDPRQKPIVINQTLKTKLFGNEDPIGKIVTSDEGKNKMKITGVVKDLKNRGDYNEPGNAVFSRMDTSEYRWQNTILVKVSDDADAAFEGQLYKTIASQVQNSNIEIEHLTDKRTSKNNMTLVPMIILLIVGTFLIINVALGLYGVLWYNINKRKGEIGLRRAVGASGNAISSQLVGEALVLATMALIVGTFFAVQFPLLHVFDLPSGVYLVALGISIVFIYLLVVLCALYPGKQAAAIYPAVALHEE